MVMWNTVYGKTFKGQKFREQAREITIVNGQFDLQLVRSYLHDSGFYEIKYLLLTLSQKNFMPQKFRVYLSV